jgi:hypothetical protein
MIWKFFIPLISLSGLFFGILLAKISPEEMLPGKKYLTAFYLAMLFTIACSLAYMSRLYLILAIGLVIGFFLPLLYLYLGIALVGSFFSSDNELLLISSLIFMIGLPFGSLFASNKFNYNKLLYYILIFLAPLIMFLLPVTDSHVMFSLSSGLLFGCFFSSLLKKFK